MSKSIIRVTNKNNKIIQNGTILNNFIYINGYWNNINNVRYNNLMHANMGYIQSRINKKITLYIRYKYITRWPSLSDWDNDTVRHYKLTFIPSGFGYNGTDYINIKYIYNKTNIKFILGKVFYENTFLKSYVKYNEIIWDDNIDIYVHI
jgi:hypothetical protein